MTHNIANTKESLQNIVRFKSMTYIFIQAVLMFNYFRTSIYKTGAKELNIITTINTRSRHASMHVLRNNIHSIINKEYF